MKKGDEKEDEDVGEEGGEGGHCVWFLGGERGLRGGLNFGRGKRVRRGERGFFLKKKLRGRLRGEKISKGGKGKAYV